MTHSAAVTKHHTAWVHGANTRPCAVRYAVDGDRLVCFGDDLPADAANGHRVFVTIHEIAGGPALSQLSFTVHDVAADEVDPNAVVELLDHVSLGRTRAEVDTAIARHRLRRLVALGT